MASNDYHRPADADTDSIGIESLPAEIQTKIFSDLSAIDRVRIELVSKKWRYLVRRNGWGPELELDFLCMENFDRLGQIGFQKRVRQLVLFIKNQCVNFEDLDHPYLIGQKLHLSTAFPNLVHLRINHDHGYGYFQKSALFEQIGKLTQLKSLSLAYYNDLSYSGLPFTFPSSLDLLVLDQMQLGTSFPRPARPLKSLWLNNEIRRSLFFGGLLVPGICHLGLGNLRLTTEAVQTICDRLNNRVTNSEFSLCHLSFNLSDSLLNIDVMAQMFSNLSALVSLEVDNIGQNEFCLVLNHCKRLEHFAFSFSVKHQHNGNFEIVPMLHALRALPTGLVRLRSLDFLLANMVTEEPMNSLADEFLAPTMRELANQGRIEFLSVTLFGWNDQRGKRVEVHLPDDVALQFVLRCNSLRYLGHQFQQSESSIELAGIMDRKLANGERSLAARRLLLLAEQSPPPFSHPLVAFCRQKPRNHVFAHIRASDLTSVPPDYFFTENLQTRPSLNKY